MFNKIIQPICTIIHTLVLVATKRTFFQVKRAMSASKGLILIRLTTTYMNVDSEQENK